jgi:hypothetical protein
MLRFSKSLYKREGGAQASQACSHSLSKAGAQNKLRLAKNAQEQKKKKKERKKALCKFVQSRKNREGPGPVLGADV